MSNAFNHKSLRQITTGNNTAPPTAFTTTVAPITKKPGKFMITYSDSCILKPLITYTIASLYIIKLYFS